MATTSNITKISKEYERLYQYVDEQISYKQDTIILLNDLFVISILLKKNGLSDIKNVMPFVEDYKKYIVSYDLLKKLNLIELNNVFTRISNLVNMYDDLSDFEKLFGSVLEKHINRKKTGSYYTPEDTTKFICWNTIFISILNKLPAILSDKICSSINISNNVEFIDKKMSFEEKTKIIAAILDGKDIEIIIKVIKKLTIIDPTCGSGAFIISAYECLSFLNMNLLQRKLDKNFYYCNLFGVDIQEEAISLSKTRLLIKTIIDDNFSERIVKVIENNFVCGDALSGSDRVLESGTIGFDWRNYKDFDCIVGNPPYVEVKDRTKYSHFNSVNCGNLYAYAIERSCNIAHLNSMISFIVPLPLISTSRMNDIKTYLERKSSIVYYCTFADRPGCLFSGVHQRLVIFFAMIGNDDCRRFTSSYNFWYKDERNSLFKSLDFIENRNEYMPKIGTNIENSIYVKSRICDSSVDLLTSKDGKHKLYVSSRIGFWAKAFLEKPATNEIMTLSFESDIERKIAYCFINSSLFYYQWVITSDCWHVTNADLKNIKFNYSVLNARQKRKLLELSDILSEDLEKNKVRIDSKQTEFEYKHKYSKKIIDKIDDILCQCAGLDQTETKYVKNYTLKYRLNKIEEGDN